MECVKQKVNAYPSEEEKFIRPIARNANGLKIVRKISSSNNSNEIRNYNEHYDSHADWGNSGR